MRRCLVDKLACPECRGDMELAKAVEENAIRVLQGTLRCVPAAKCYPIEKGVPRLVKVADGRGRSVSPLLGAVAVALELGKFEGERCYGFDDNILHRLGEGTARVSPCAGPGDWLLDAGCGSGEKTRVLACQCPEQNVVGLDLGVESLEKAMAQFGDMPNLDYVQGNIMEPPFKDRQFDAGMSLGVLHHTNNTREAFARFRRLLKEETTCVIWIYPTYWEGPEWRMPYFARDVITFGQGYRLPTGLLRFIARAIVIGFYPDRAVLLLEELPPHRPRLAVLPRRQYDLERAIQGPGVLLLRYASAALSMAAPDQGSRELVRRRRARSGFALAQFLHGQHCAGCGRVPREHAVAASV